MRENTTGSRLREGRQIVVSFELVEAGDTVVARLLESVRRTGLSLLSVHGDERQVYPFEGRGPRFVAASWTAKLLCPVGPRNLDWQLQVFVGRAELFLGLDGGLRLWTLGGGPVAVAGAV